MADGLQVDPGSGAKVDTDELTVSGETRHQQVVKIGLGNRDTDGGLVSLTNPMPVVQQAAANAAVSGAPMTTSSATILAANNDRKGFKIFNEANDYLYVKFGTAASPTSFTNRLDPYELWEREDGYTGIITGALASGTGTARATELTR